MVFVLNQHLIEIYFIRNLVRVVHQLLLEAYNNNIINENNCVIYGFGQNKGKHLIFGNFYYEDLGFLEIDSYSKLMRESDILISFQMAPHPSYPPLEMSHCNGICLHTEFSNKDNNSMSRYSDKVILSKPSIPVLSFVSLGVNFLNGTLFPSLPSILKS